MSGVAGGRSRVRSVQAMTLHNTAIPSGSKRIDSKRSVMALVRLRRELERHGSTRSGLIQARLEA